MNKSKTEKMKEKLKENEEIRICNRCKEEYIATVDSMGVRYNTVCNTCKGSRKEKYGTGVGNIYRK